ncbi:hypothetical protein DP42_4547 [Burkholderia pseudomallei]|nr:hypothetical protein DP42_4547 [Burkholderia pseudomallei]
MNSVDSARFENMSNGRIGCAQRFSQRHSATPPASAATSSSVGQPPIPYFGSHSTNSCIAPSVTAMRSAPGQSSRIFRVCSTCRMCGR